MNGTPHSKRLIFLSFILILSLFLTLHAAGEDTGFSPDENAVTEELSLDEPAEEPDEPTPRSCFIDEIIALGRQLYTVSGDFSLMTKWNRFFGSDTAEIEDRSEKGLKNPSMTTMLIPGIVYWTAISFNPRVGSIITLVVCAFPTW